MQWTSHIKTLDAKVPRSEFITSKDIPHLISGHSIPTEQAVRQIMTWLAELDINQPLLLIGAGSGYLSAALAQCVPHLYVLDKNPACISIALKNLQRLNIRNVEFLVGDANRLIQLKEPVVAVIATCLLQSLDAILPVVHEQGWLLRLEGDKPHHTSMVLYQKNQQKLVRQKNLGALLLQQPPAAIQLDVATKQALQLTSTQAKVEKKPVSAVLQQLSEQAKTALEVQAQQHGWPVLSAHQVLQQLNPALFMQFSRTFLDHHRVLPIAYHDKQLLLITDSTKIDTLDLENMNGSGGISIALVSPTDFRRIWSHLDVSSRGEQHAEPGTVQDEARTEPAEPVINPYLVSVYEAILLEAVSERASDIHLELYDGKVRIRLRVDGDLHDVEHYVLTAKDLIGLVNIIKIRAELNIAEHRLPQGGRALLHCAGDSYDLRVQTQPALHGEHVIIRLLKHTGRAMTMRELGMSGKVAQHYQRLLSNPAGLVLVVGPTGSGKSTTLYAGLQELADDGRRKVITAEDPIEYSINGIQQTRIRPDIGFAFPDAVRSFVRQDPDVILVGEIRDHETAQEAIRASQTGHLVLSTLHCNDAVDALQRLYDLGVHPNSIASELLAVIAQRLAKRICPHCRTEVEADPVILQEVFPEGAPASFRCFEGAGCPECHQRGTKGRVAVIEYMQANSAIRNAISKQEPVAELRWQALDSGLITMRDSALDLVISGVIPLSELPRILPAERMAPEQRGGNRS
ncbi:ATPase, T2SS/T4P/T4SS family [Alkalimonas sp.]|uniref:ATPase, T2SS/T4P/T4SS family n=1 Tax=Alkalimonas sp. TaxID=1872453 RepID=UPI00263B15D8|nr:ATPase, T2SS/T4P/T4SS family [Alkalimonas sp.]MCC5826869.1 Flp pilus assembly complex ATPase component TadA [Alkalimonas sp.]